MATTRASATKSNSLLSPSVASRQTNKLTRQPIKCPVCTEEVIDGGGRKKGQESVFCDGRCQEWVHRQCAGLSKVAFQAVSNSEAQFRCPRCIIIQQAEEISALRASVDALACDVKLLHEKIADITTNSSQAVKAATDKPTAKVISPTTVVEKPLPSTSHGPRSVSTTTTISESDRKYNVVLFGIPESSQGTPRFKRITNDYSEACSILSNLEKDDIKCNVRDCRRIGKYNIDNVRPRPMLVTLNSTAEVRLILTNYSALPPTVTVKPDRSLSERKVDKILMSERWKLIKAGSNRRSIRIRNSSIYLNGRLYGKVVDSTFSLSPSLRELAPELASVSIATASNKNNVSTLSSSQLETASAPNEDNVLPSDQTVSSD